MVEKVGGKSRPKGRAKADVEQQVKTWVADELDEAMAEIEALRKVRAALESERKGLEAYQDGLRSHVQELAASMVSFMNTEIPTASAAVIESLEVPELAEPGVEEFAGTPVVRSDPSGPPALIEMFGPAATGGDRSTPISAAEVEEMAEEERFRAFIGGDDDDRSRDWLMQEDES